MAFGFNTKYSTNIPLGETPPEQWLAAALRTARELGWETSQITTHGFIAYTPFSLKSYGEVIKVTLDQHEALIESKCTSSQILDYGKNKKNTERFVSELHKQIPGGIIDDHQNLSAQSDPDAITLHDPANFQENAALFSVASAKNFIVTYSLISINFLVFLIMCLDGVSVFSPTTADMIEWGGNLKHLTLDGGSWRLISSCFLHIGLIHLLFNMYALFYIGSILEPLLGRKLFIVAYLLSGIAASTASLLWHDLTVSAGASGAIFGMYGLFLALLATNLIQKAARTSLLSSIVFFVAYNLIGGMRDGVDNAGHIGGLLAGLLLGGSYYFILRDPSNTSGRKLITISTSIVILLFTATVYLSSTNNIGIYESNMSLFTANEERALDFYRLPENTLEEEQISSLKRGIKWWYENKKILRSCKRLDLPPIYEDHLNHLEIYLTNRINSYNLIKRSLEEDTDKFTYAIDQCQRNIQEVLTYLESASQK